MPRQPDYRAKVLSWNTNRAVSLSRLDRHPVDFLEYPSSSSSQAEEMFAIESSNPVNAPPINCGSWCKITPVQYTDTFVFSIDNFMKNVDFIEKSGFNSSIFYVKVDGDETQWRLSVSISKKIKTRTKPNYNWQPRYESESNSESNSECMMVMASLTELSGKAVLAHGQLHILNVQNQKVESHKFATDLENYTTLEIRLETLANKPAIYLPGDCLTVVRDIIILGKNVVVAGGKNKTDNQDSHIKKLSNDMKKILETKLFTDCTIICGNEEIPCHRNILSSRSPVFETMFSSDMKEASTGVVEIEDFTGATVKELVNYIYTGCPASAKPEELLRAAHKYLMEELKDWCVEQLCKVASVDNAVDHLVLAEVYEAPVLKESATLLIVRNWSSISKREQWRSVIQTHPQAFADVIDKLMDRAQQLNLL